MRRSESRSFSPWVESSSPARILLIRFHAMGDVALVLPAAAAIHALHPSAAIDVLTSPAAAGLVTAVALAGEVIAPPFPGRHSGRIPYALRTGILARSQRYDIILDLQRNWMSRTIRRIASPRAWGEFDRFSPHPAWERIRETSRRTGLAIGDSIPSIAVTPERQSAARQLLSRRGRTPEKKLVIFNPAGLWQTRNWPPENYVELGKIWRERMPVQFLLIGTERMREKAAMIASGLDGDTIDLTGATTLADAMGCVAEADCMVSEDSGLMHMAWAAGVPVVALFGSSRHDWSAPYGPRAVTLHSGDLPCGACMDPACRFGDVHCLTRYAPERVLDEATLLLQHSMKFRTT